MAAAPLRIEKASMDGFDPRRLRRELSERRVLVVENLRAAGIPILGDDAGSHVVVLLPSVEREREVVRRAARLGVRLDGLERRHAGPPRWHGVAIGYTACSRDQLISVLRGGHRACAPRSRETC